MGRVGYWCEGMVVITEDVQHGGGVCVCGGVLV